MSVFPHRRKRPALRWVQRVLLALGVAMVAYVGMSLLDAKVFQAYENRRLNEMLSNTRMPAALDEPELPRSSSESFEVVHRSRTAPGSMLGRLEIKRVGVAVVIMEGVDSKTLQRAVGHVAGTALPGEHGNTVVAGHRDNYFRALRDVQLNDEIKLTTLDGTFLYQVDTVKVVGAEETDVLKASDEPILTLVTCYPFYFVGPAPKRFVVRAHRVLSEAEANAEN